MDRDDIKEGFIVGCLAAFLIAGIIVMGFVWFA
jgi:hypothetical protein